MTTLQISSPPAALPEVAPSPAGEAPRRWKWTGDDLMLVVEVADTSLQHDRDLKLPAYARAGIPEYWIVNLPERKLEIYRQPAGDDYQLHSIHRSGETVEALAAPGAALAVAELFG